MLKLRVRQSARANENGEHVARRRWEIGGFDVPMIKTLGKAFYWERLIDDGTYSTTTDLAHAMKVEPGWAAEVLRMTMLAPDIVEAIFEGRQPRHLNLHTLRGRQEQLPRDWAAQRRLLGFSDA